MVRFEGEFKPRAHSKGKNNCYIEVFQWHNGIDNYSLVYTTQSYNKIEQAWQDANNFMARTTESTGKRYDY